MPVLDGWDLPRRAQARFEVGQAAGHCLFGIGRARSVSAGHEGPSVLAPPSSIQQLERVHEYVPPSPSVVAAAGASAKRPSRRRPVNAVSFHRARLGARRVVACRMRGSASAAVLMVDDHPRNLVALTAVLEPLGYELVSAIRAPKPWRLASGREFSGDRDGRHDADPRRHPDHSRHPQAARGATRYVPIIFLKRRWTAGAPKCSAPIKAAASTTSSSLTEPTRSSARKCRSSSSSTNSAARSTDQRQLHLAEGWHARCRPLKPAARSREELLSIVSHELPATPSPRSGPMPPSLLRRAATIEDNDVHRYAMQAMRRRAEDGAADRRSLLVAAARAERGALRRRQEASTRVRSWSTN